MLTLTIDPKHAANPEDCLGVLLNAYESDRKHIEGNGALKFLAVGLVELGLASLLAERLPMNQGLTEQDYVSCILGPRLQSLGFASEAISYMEALAKEIYQQPKEFEFEL